MADSGTAVLHEQSRGDACGSEAYEKSACELPGARVSERCVGAFLLRRRRGGDEAEAQTRFLGSATLPDNHPMLVIGECGRFGDEGARRRRASSTLRWTSRSIGGFGGTSSSVMMEYDQRQMPVRFSSAIVGSVDDPRRLTERVTVPRGQITFQSDFIGELKAIARRRGSDRCRCDCCPRPPDTQYDGDHSQSRRFLSRAVRCRLSRRCIAICCRRRVRRPANSVVERTLAYILEHRTPRAIPCELLGEGVLVTPRGSAIVELLSGADPAALAARLSMRSKR